PVLYASTQLVSVLGQQVDDAHGKPRVLTPHMGGGFGSKFSFGLEGKLAYELAHELGRPVHLMLSRSDEFTMGGNRSGSWQRLRLGADAEGTLTALHLEAEKHGGMGGGAHAGAPYHYEVANVASSIRSLHTATDANRAMRAPGHPQASYGMETAVDGIAYQLGMDPLELRKKNLTSPTHHRQLDRVAQEIGWNDHPNRNAPGEADGGVRVGIGFGVAGWGPGSRNCQVDVTVEPDGRVVSATATQDLGTGARTYVAAIVAEELGLGIDQVTARIGDNELPPSVPSGGSVTTGSSAPAVKHAAHLAREALEAKLEPVLEAPVGSYTWKGGRVSVTSDPERSLAWREVCALLASTLRVTGETQESLYHGRIHGAQAAKVEVDTLTGCVRVLKMVAMQDQGLPLNRMALRSQINGGMIQALSYALLEQRVFDAQDGYLLSDSLDTYRIAGSREMPELVAIIDDDDERDAVSGMAEAPIIPGQSAIANAIYNACGARLTRMPFTPDNVLEAIHGKV
ncbi:MAG: molybdopterin cofactor-binding domain-containing protein, partial [Planctomycetota bacterium]